MTQTTPSSLPAQPRTFVDPAADIRDEIAAENNIPELPDKIWFHKTASAVIDAGRCIGCGSCIAACPSRSISVGTDGHPTLVKMCTGCSACWDYCPMAGIRVERLGGEVEGQGEPEGRLGPVLAAYAARAVDRAGDSQDGGAVTGLLAELLEVGHIDGAVVTRRIDALRGEPFLALTPEDVRKAAGTIYHQSHTLAALNDPLPPGIRRLAFVGTPCQVSALRALQRFPWQYRRSTAGAVVLAIALFCTRSFDPEKLEQAIAGSGVDIAGVAQVDIRGNQLVVKEADGAEMLRRPVRDFASATLRGCEECADFTGLTADLAMGSLASEPGCTTVLVRTDAGLAAVDRGAGALAIEPIGDLAPLRATAARDLRRAEQALARGFDREGPLWISYTEHLAAYEGTGRAPTAPPSFRSHHYDVSC
jgi:coenzyme F420 hydrogenase subunit beta